LLLHRAPESPNDNEYLDLIFIIDDWSGEPTIGEPDKCTELVWADLRQLPNDTPSRPHWQQSTQANVSCSTAGPGSGTG
jgi:hypothetical protein